MDCIFCKIVSGEIPTRKVYEDDCCIAFADLHPQAPVHLLVIPRRHIVSLAHAGDEKEMFGQLVWAANELARWEKLSKGYRVVMNTGPDGGQTVDHLHLHLLGGRAMHWPPG